jgi:hypothetical protein
MQLKQLAPAPVATVSNDGDNSIIESVTETNADGDAASGDGFEDYFGDDDVDTSAQFDTSLYGDVDEAGDVSMMGDEVTMDAFGGDAADDELLGDKSQIAPPPEPESDSDEEEILESGIVM